ISLLDRGTRFGVEALLPVPAGELQPDTPLELEGGIAVTAGKIQAQRQGARAVELTPLGGYARWPADGGELTSNAEVSVPLWILPDANFVTPAAKQVARLYQRELEDSVDVEGI